MAITTNVTGSNYRGTFAGHELIEVSLTDTAANGQTKSAAISLGRTYRSVKPVAAVASSGGAAAVPVSTEVVDTSSVKVAYNATGNVTVIATFECEV